MIPHRQRDIIAKARELTVPPNEFPDPGMQITVELFHPTITYRVWFFKKKIANTPGWAVLKIEIVK